MWYEKYVPADSAGSTEVSTSSPPVMCVTLFRQFCWRLSAHREGDRILSQMVATTSSGSQPGDFCIGHGLKHRYRARPRRGPLSQFPAEDIRKAAIRIGVVGVEKPQAVEVVVRLPRIVRILGRHRSRSF